MRGAAARKNPLRAAYGKVLDFELYCHIISQDEHDGKKEHPLKPHLDRGMSVRI
jgi:hypothetical protein